MKAPSTLLLAALLAGAPAFAQANADPEIDVLLADLTDITAVARQGVFPGGVNACVMATTACNVGTKQINWQAPMSADHPFIGFLVVRERAGRFEQVSDRSFVKHGFFALSSTFCGTCTNPANPALLGVGCSDTYSVNSNGNQLYLGPPEEIDPWLGRWEPRCSHFDRGEPPVAPPGDCNAARSLTAAQVAALGPMPHRIRMTDADLLGGGLGGDSVFWFQAQYVLATEPEGARTNNLGSRELVPVWSGTSWNLVERGAILYDSVLQRWSGASVSSATNGADDGRVYAAVKVTGPDPLTGFYRYEYALHNRDNRQGVGTLRIPVCPGARVRNLGFGDVDDEAANDWNAGVVAGEIVFSTSTNPLGWNTIYNVWFDCDAAPAAGALVLDQAVRDAGQDALLVSSRAPLELPNPSLGPGCALDTPPSLFALGTPPRATLGNATFALRSTGNAALQPVWLRYSVVPGSFQQAGCTRYLGPGPGHSFALAMVPSDAAGTVDFAVPVPNDLALEGLAVDLQATARDPGQGALRGNFELSDGLRVRIGNALSGCP